MTVNDEIANAEAFEPKPDRLYIATTAKRDAVLQKTVREISGRRAKTGLFKVDVLFWDDICQDLAKDDEIFFRHYPQFRHLCDELAEDFRNDGVVRYSRGFRGLRHDDEHLELSGRSARSLRSRTHDAAAGVHLRAHREILPGYPPRLAALGKIEDAGDGGRFGGLERPPGP
jgi:hypothetical protein